MKSKEPLKAAEIGREDDRMDRNARWVGLETGRKGAGKELSRDMLSGSGAMVGRGRVLTTLAFLNYHSCWVFYILSILKYNTFRTGA